MTGDPSKSTEDTKISTKLSFLQDTYLAVGSVMIPLYILMAILAGPEVVAEASGGKNYIVFAIMQGITFCVGLFILLTGVRLLIAELVPAFAGIAKKIVPGARPALDCPVLFTYAPNAIVYGFIFTTVGTIIGMFLWPLFGLPMVIPGIMSNFFAGGTAAIFATPPEAGAVPLSQALCTACLFPCCRPSLRRIWGRSSLKACPLWQLIR